MHIVKNKTTKEWVLKVHVYFNVDKAALFSNLPFHEVFGFSVWASISVDTLLKVNNSFNAVEAVSVVVEATVVVDDAVLIVGNEDVKVEGIVGL